MSDGQTILWRRLDTPGHEIATVERDADGWRLHSVAIFADAGAPCCLDSEIRCDAEWHTKRCIVRGTIGARPVHREIGRDSSGTWSADGVEILAVRGCDDIDLGWSPVTNLLPIRRIALAVGQRALVRAAWVRFPELTLEVLEQSYARVAPMHYHYESAHGSFQRELTVDAFGCVVHYPALWRADATATLGAPGA